MSLHMKWLMVYNIVYTGIRVVQCKRSVWAYLTCKIGYWRKESSCFFKWLFHENLFFNGCKTGPGAKMLTTFLIKAWCLTGRWPSKQRGICWKLGRSLLIKALCNLVRQCKCRVYWDIKLWPSYFCISVDISHFIFWPTSFSKT